MNVNGKEFESGTVVWYNNEKRYGFARDSWRMQIFFHLNDGRHCRVEKSELKMFARSAETYGKFHLVPEPVAEDVILFSRAKGSKGRDKASPWTFQYMETEAWLDYEQDQIPCSNCGHLMEEHSGFECQHILCHCGDEAYEHDEDEPRQVWFTESPGGHNGWE
ncbi:MAG: hypothetical protein UU12_C0006G0009 [Candidatus Woesebacteria bacterium GW2011_GWA2_40_7b]|uniref:Uncharacterized protein n=1 Tax=Candidatus Woesebacteria bacterium GW2011_GWA2_40_7b TaxID=1618563 RepID=A0A0G0VGK3_9BACT|nr:MAG: hypothetical protein UU12_C0006G0009 [Candidatus Woesebacteria bacterium GW2011_GWA2_40_7b]